MNGKRLILYNLFFILCSCKTLEIKERYEDVDINGAKRNILNSLSVKIEDQELLFKSKNHKDPYIKDISRQEYFLHVDF
jgi:hypothetical protein